jgi:hypothetical protein
MRASQNMLRSAGVGEFLDLVDHAGPGEWPWTMEAGSPFGAS